jgi:hypothetical protein
MSVTEDQLRLFSALNTLLVYDERSRSVTAGAVTRHRVRKCATMKEVEGCLTDARLVPLGGVRVGEDGRRVVLDHSYRGNVRDSNG